MGTLYADAMNRQIQLYNQVVGGYTNLMNQQQVAAANIGSNYDSVIRNVLGGLDQSGNTERQAIRDRYMANMGQAQQQLTSRGLGNTTVASAVGRGLGYDADKSYGAVSERVAGQKAQYQTQLSLASLAEQERSNELYARLGQGMYQEMGQVGRMPDIGPYLSYDAQMAAINARNSGGGGVNVIPSKGYGAPGTGYGPIAWPDGGGGGYVGGGGYPSPYSGGVGGGYASPVYGGTGNMGSAYGGGGDWGDPAATIPYSDDGWAYTEE